MLIVTQKLKDHAVKNWGASATATVAQIRQLVGLKLFQANVTQAEIDKINAGGTALTDTKAHTPPTPAPAPTAASLVTDDSVNAMVAALEQRGYSLTPAGGGGGAVAASGVSPETVFNKSVQVRVKSVAEKFNRTKRAAVYPSVVGRGTKAMLHPMAGQPAKCGDVYLEHPSDFDKALIGAYFKWSLSGQRNRGQIDRRVQMTELDNDIINYALRECEWTGVIRPEDAETLEGGTKVHRRKLQEWEVKAILDDNTSGGNYAAPIAFDDALVTIPVLYGELFPFVNVVPVARGKSMQGASMGNPTFTSGTAEGTAITPFNTAGFIGQFNTTIYPAVGAMEIGLDWESDSPISFGDKIVEAYGFKALEFLDQVIAVGNGTTQPLGIFNTTGAISVSADNGAAGPVTVSDHEGLMFGPAKAYRNEPGAVNVFLGNDVMYRRARAIPVGPTDERRVFGMDHMDYMLFGYPYKVQNSIPNGYIAYANLRRYRMYRRLGLQVRFVDDGRTLTLANERMIVVRMRYGGQMESGSAMAKMTDAQG